ncbi:MAG: hypothetical protein ACREQV_06800 [Candidatus Binatia bacterium]
MEAAKMEGEEYRYERCVKRKDKVAFGRKACADARRVVWIETLPDGGGCVFEFNAWVSAYAAMTLDWPIRSSNRA